MVMLRVSAASALCLLVLVVQPVWSQVTMTPESPRWGDILTITADPSVPLNEPERFYKDDRLYAIVYERHQGHLKLHERFWAPMTWNGHHFVAQIKLPHGCEGDMRKSQRPSAWSSRHVWSSSVDDRMAACRQAPS